MIVQQHPAGAAFPPAGLVAADEGHNYSGSLKHPQIVASLKEAGLTGAARDAEKMKKGDAAAHAQHFMQQTRWVPA